MQPTGRSLALALGILFTAPMVAGAAMLKVGDPFPVWDLADQTGARVSSSSLAGTTYLMWFYPKAMTPGCTAEGQGLRDSFAAFQAHGVRIVGVSFDDPTTNAAFVAK